VRRAHAAKKMREYRKQNNVPFTHRWWVLRLLSTHSRLTVPDVRKIEQRFVQRPCCEYCSVNLSTTPEKLQFDHRIPKSRGGEYSEVNTAITCDACNRLKLDMTDTEFRAFLLEYISRFDAPIQATVHSLADYAKKEPSL
jgi:5-methylcytosine-specific restriction endonuclease McrA